MVEKNAKQKTSFLNKPFDLNRNGKIDPAEAALMMMVIDDMAKQIDKEKVEDFPSRTSHITPTTINIDDMDIEGI